MRFARLVDILFSRLVCIAKPASAQRTNLDPLIARGYWLLRAKQPAQKLAGSLWEKAALCIPAPRRHQITQ